MEKDEARKRKAHTKSRKGCSNCKLRRVKCDEEKPHCLKCIQYGVQCSYDGPAADKADLHSLQLPGEGSFTFASESPRSTLSSIPTGTTAPEPRDSLSPDSSAKSAVDVIHSLLDSEIDLHDSVEKYQLTNDDTDTLRRFHYRTIFSIGTARTVGIYRQHMIELASRSSCLTHIVLALTLMHDRYLSEPWSSPPSRKEAFHLYHGTAIFNSLLSQPIKDADRDPLWGSCALLGCTTIASMDATTPEEAWPLKPDSIDDLDWLRMSDGKKEVWRMVNPLREGSVFREALSQEGQKDPEPYRHAVPELQLLFPYLTKLYDFDSSRGDSTAAEEEQDPYHTAASILVRLLELECNHSTIMYFLSFLGHMDPRFRELLHKKDARAMLLLAWWYGKMSQYSVWWQSRRMRLEGQAICIYLERYHGNEEGVMKLLDYPKLMTGLYVR